jgi:hypothetical protein
MEKEAYRGPGAIARMLGREVKERAPAALQEVAKATSAGKGYSKAKQVGALEALSRKAGVGAATKGKNVMKHLKSNKGKYLAGLGGAAGVGAATAGAYQAGKKKAASALDALAEQRALEMLKEAGYSTEEDQLKEAVDQRALEMLAEAGYIGG